MSGRDEISPGWAAASGASAVQRAILPAFAADGGGELGRPLRGLPYYLPRHTPEQVAAAIDLARRGVPVGVVADQHGRILYGRLVRDGDELAQPGPEASREPK